jgi:hypothetical protein
MEYGRISGSWKNKQLYIFIKRVIKVTVVIIRECHCYQLHTELYLTSFSFRIWTDLLSIVSADFYVIVNCWSDIRIHQILEKRQECNETVYLLFIDFKKLVTVVSKSFGYIAEFRYSGVMVTNQNLIDGVKIRLNSANASCHSIQNHCVPVCCLKM